MMLLFNTIIFNNEKTPLQYAFEKDNIEIFKLLMSYDNIDVNCKLISTKLIYIVINYIFKYNLNLFLYIISKK